MILRLNPAIPLVWRDPHTIQAGVDRPLAMFPGMTAPLERVVLGLQAGVPEPVARLLGEEAGASAEAIDALLNALVPALLPLRNTGSAAVDAPRSALVEGTGPTAERIGGLLAELGIRSYPPAEEPAVVVLVAHYAMEPERHGRWLRRDVPHLPVVFSDTEVRVGPLVAPGDGPCLSCLEHHRIDADPAWPAIAIQLLRHLAATETEPVSREVAALAAALVDAFLRSGENPLVAASLVIDPATAVVSRREHLPHAGCGCRALPGIVTVLAGSAAADRRRPSSATADGVPA